MHHSLGQYNEFVCGTLKCVKCFRLLLLVSSWALYLVKPLRRTLSPNSWRNSSRAGPAVSLLYISSSVLWPALQYITPTFT